MLWGKSRIRRARPNGDPMLIVASSWVHRSRCEREGCPRLEQHRIATISSVENSHHILPWCDEDSSTRTWSVCQIGMETRSWSFRVAVKTGPKPVTAYVTVGIRSCRDQRNSGHPEHELGRRGQVERNGGDGDTECAKSCGSTYRQSQSAGIVHPDWTKHCSNATGQARGGQGDAADESGLRQDRDRAGTASSSLNVQRTR